ncbi:helix-turn-helix transcriptional regulator [Brachybacterium sp. NBEC-018]|uniref:helix-turn-helix transcriptional regulator n=1 Tax=Brachybacterium sp. NBEC-018 TaxID=2996004 RepID=UPI0021752A27|nr:helix-turn-helix transcriptional regulator [Brachybacterium sp. NBEC-018]UVY83069.1 helix-turn-helix transcriptional regulator [Brachybacterium sp. NBEC-018]
MDHQEELRGFLISRRARLTPEDAGMTPFPGIRRVAGMRREEVAYLAGISVDYHTRLERGRVQGISEEILVAVSRALRLDDVEHEHLLRLVQALRPQSARRAPARRPSAPEGDGFLQRVVDEIDAPAFVQNSRLDIVAANRIGWKLFPHAEQHIALGDGTRFNAMRFQVLDPRAKDFYVDWDLAVRNGTAVLHEAAGRQQGDKVLFALIGELSARSEHFRSLWASHDVLRYRRSPKRYHHPLVGDVVVDSQSFTVDKDPDLSLLVYKVEPDSPTADAMAILGGWAADSPGPVPAAVPHDGTTP